MRYSLFSNWSILLGFLLAIFSIAGMTAAVFMPESISFDLQADQGIGALDVPLRPINPDPIIVEEQEEIQSEPIYVEEIAELGNWERSSQISLSPSNQESVEPLLVKADPPQSENALVVQLLPEVPVRIVIPSIGLDAPIVPAPVDFENIAGVEFLQWFVPDEFASGWHTTSAMLGETGNTVLNGHHNAFGEVFVSLVDLNEGDFIWVESAQSRFKFQITNKMILSEKYEQLDVRMNNAQWILPSIDERLTLISCWPYETNTHRLIVVARPMGREEITPKLE
jgi:LPXTG-site transpeptidase (sortase) family protein